MINEQLYTEWIDALKSNNYAKTHQYLRDNNGFCCLGVLCDITDSSGWNSETGVVVNSLSVADYIYSYNPRNSGKLPSTFALPLEIQREVGIPSTTGKFLLRDLPADIVNKIYELNITVNEHREHYSCSLAAINDGTPDFDLIIKVLEARPPSLFNYPYKD